MKYNPILMKFLYASADWDCDYHQNPTFQNMIWWMDATLTRSQAVARIADRTAKNCRGPVT